MADWQVTFTEPFGEDNLTGSFRPENLSFSIKNSEPGEINFEIPLSEPTLRHNQFGPYRTDYHLYRIGSGGNRLLLVEGMVTSVNLNNDRDTILVSGKDWLHYLQRRIYPWNPVAYKNGDWVKWPQGWPHFANSLREKEGNAVEVRQIVEDILERMQTVTLPALPNVAPDTTPGRGQLDIQFNNVNTGVEVRYTILPGDQTTVFEHIQKLSEQAHGFEFDILPGSREFKMWSPDRLQANPIYRFTSMNPVGTEAFGAYTNIDWTNDGPQGTFLVGVGESDHRIGRVWYYGRSIDQYRWLDQVYDFGSIKNDELIFGLLKDQDDLFPQRKLSLTILNPEFLAASFYLGGRPRSVIGQRVNIIHHFSPYWSVNSDHRVNAINWSVDQSTNESIDLELEMIYDDTINVDPTDFGPPLPSAP